MPSLNSVWIPTFVVAHVIGFCIWLYAVQTIFGALTYYKWKIMWIFVYKKRYNGDIKIAWYWTYPGAKEAFDASAAAGANVEMKAVVEEQDDELQTPPPAEVRWNNLVYRVRGGTPPRIKTVVHKCSGNFVPCHAYALMGPSGAGKSSLLDLLSGRKIGKGISGQITVNGAPLTAENASKFASYVSQEDVFIPTLTVWEALSFYTNLSLPGDFTNEERKKRMELAINTIGLKKCRNSKVGGYMSGGIDVKGISGGEKRRLSVCCGLVANPSVLYLDEPTTGLDAFAALNVMSHLIGLKSKGLTIVASIHQPRQEVFEAFDEVLVMSEGYQVYKAPPSYAFHWFGNVMGFPYNVDFDGTIADWLISVVSVTFYKSKEAASRSLSSTEEVRVAAKRFSTLQLEAEEQGEELISSILDTATSVTVQNDEPQDYRRAANKWLLSSLADQHARQSTAAAGADEINNTMAQIKAAKEEEAELEAIGTSSWQDEFFRKNLYPRGWFTQFSILWWRTVISALRNPAACAVRLLVAVYVSMFAGLVYIRLPDDQRSLSPRLATLFFATLLFQMVPFSFMSFYLADRRFFRRDSANGLYKPSAYAAAAFLGSAPFVVVNTCAGVLTFYGLCGLRDDWRSILLAMVIISLHSLAATQFVVFTVWIMDSQDGAFTVASVYIAFNLVLCGFYIRIQDIRLSVLKGLSWATYSKYTFQGLVHNELANRVWANTCNVNKPIAPVSGGAIPTCSTTGQQILDYYNFRLNIGTSIGALIAFVLLFNLLSYFALLKMYYKRK